MFTNQDIDDEIIYDVDYFIKKFEAIPSDDIGCTELNNHCALWHCGVRSYANEVDYRETEESKALVKLFKTNTLDKDLLNNKFKIVWKVNDSCYLVEGDTPKERILNYLYQIRDKYETKTT